MDIEQMLEAMEVVTNRLNEENRIRESRERQARAMEESLSRAGL